MNDLQIDLVDPVMSHYPRCFSEIPTSGENLPKAISSQLVIIKQNRAPPACTNLQYFAIVFLKLSRKNIYLLHVCWPIIYLLHVCWPTPLCCKGKRKRGEKKTLMKVTKIGFLGVRNFVFFLLLFFYFLVSCFFAFFWFLGLLVSWFSGSLFVFWRAGKTTQKWRT